MVALLFGLGAYSSQIRADTAGSFDSDDLHIRLTPRAPQQMAAFYEARGFNKAMIDKIKQYCFITVFIQNKSNRVLWLDLTKWKFTRDHAEIIRVNRPRLKELWQSMNIPLAHQSTFRWTLLPEQLDFRPNEREGGNIVLPWTDRPVSIQARFDTLADRSGAPVTVKLDNIRCQKAPS